MGTTYDDSGNPITYASEINDTSTGSNGTIWYMNAAGEVIGYYDVASNSTVSVAPVTDQAAIDAGSNAGVNDWKTLLTAVGGAVSAMQLNQINVARAQKGLPPINAAAYGPQVGVGLNAQTSQLLMYIALGLGAVMLLKRRG